MIRSFVLDWSITMAWFFDGESTPATDALLDHGGHAVVAQHCALKV